MIIETPQGSINLAAQVLFVKFVRIEIIILRQNNGCQIQVGKFQIMRFFSKVFSSCWLLKLCWLRAMLKRTHLRIYYIINM